MRNACIKSFNKFYDIEFKLKEKQKGRNQDINVNDMGNYRNIKKQLEKKEKKLAEANSQTKKLDNTSKDISTILDNLKPTPFNKNNKVISNEDIEKIKSFTKDVKDTTKTIRSVNDLNMAIKDFEYSSFKIAKENHSLKYQLELKEDEIDNLKSKLTTKDKVVNRLQAEKEKLKQELQKFKDFWHSIMGHFHKRICFDKNENYKIVSDDLYKNGIFTDDENEIANNIYRKVKPKEEIIDKNKKKNNMDEKSKIPTPVISLIPLFVLVALLAMVIPIFGGDALLGGSQVSLLIASSVCVGIAMIKYNYKWSSLEEGMAKNIKKVTPAIIILLLIGAISGTWMLSGVVPTLIYYGLHTLTPQIFLASCCLICAIVSVITGSSWTTIATIGVALLGIGKAQGFEAGWIAGAIISGAYFGDKISPLSDTTVLASSTTGTKLFTHIRYMLVTTVPSIIITLIIFTIAGFLKGNVAHEQTALFADTLAQKFNLSPWLLLVPVITGILILIKLPTIITLFISSVIAGICILIFQPHILLQIAQGETLDFTTGFKALMTSVFGSTSLSTGQPEIDALVATRGMRGMMDTIWLIICAMCFGGVMSASGMIRSITDVLVRFVRKPKSAVCSTVASGLFFNTCTADQYLSIILTGNLFKELYKNRGLESRLLSRTVEDSVTVTSVLIPWNSCGMTQATVLGVSTLTYLPYCFFNLLSPLMSMIIAFTGFKIKQTFSSELSGNNSEPIKQAA